MTNMGVLSTSSFCNLNFFLEAAVFSCYSRECASAIRPAWNWNRANREPGESPHLAPASAAVPGPATLGFPGPDRAHGARKACKGRCQLGVPELHSGWQATAEAPDSHPGASPRGASAPCSGELAAAVRGEDPRKQGTGQAGRAGRAARHEEPSCAAQALASTQEPQVPSGHPDLPAPWALLLCGWSTWSEGWRRRPLAVGRAGGTRERERGRGQPTRETTLPRGSGPVVTRRGGHKEGLEHKERLCAEGASGPESQRSGPGMSGGRRLGFQLRFN